jgi:hypothetical protein
MYLGGPGVEQLGALGDGRGERGRADWTLPRALRGFCVADGRRLLRAKLGGAGLGGQGLLQTAPDEVWSGREVHGALAQPSQLEMWRRGMSTSD